MSTIAPIASAEDDAEDAICRTLGELHELIEIAHERDWQLAQGVIELHSLALRDRLDEIRQRKVVVDMEAARIRASLVGADWDEQVRVMRGVDERVRERLGLWKKGHAR